MSQPLGLVHAAYCYAGLMQVLISSMLLCPISQDTLAQARGRIAAQFVLCTFCAPILKGSPSVSKLQQGLGWAPSLAAPPHMVMRNKHMCLAYHPLSSAVALQVGCPGNKRRPERVSPHVGFSMINSCLACPNNLYCTLLRWYMMDAQPAFVMLWTPDPGPPRQLVASCCDNCSSCLHHTVCGKLL